MKSNLLLLIIVSALLSGCGTMQFTPQEYPLRDGLIPPMKVIGNVSIKNSQDSKEAAIIYSYGGSKLASDYNKITQVMVEQSTKELKKNSQLISSSKLKSIDLKVTYLLSSYKFMYWTSELKYTATLGNGRKIDKTVTHGSGILAQDLNGCIAESVIDLFKDDSVRRYLAE